MFSNQRAEQYQMLATRIALLHHDGAWFGFTAAARDLSAKIFMLPAPLNPSKPTTSKQRMIFISSAPAAILSDDAVKKKMRFRRFLLSVVASISQPDTEKLPRRQHRSCQWAIRF
jgi:hypothetical protein